MEGLQFLLIFFIIRYAGGPQKRYPCINFAITSVNVHRFSQFFFTARTSNLRPSHLYSVITLPSKTHTAAISYRSISNVGHLTVQYLFHTCLTISLSLYVSHG